MQDKLDRLRELVLAALNTDPPLFRSVHDLSVKAEVDTASLSRFLKSPPGGGGKISFVFASKLLYAIGGRILFPDEREEDVVKFVTRPAVQAATQIVDGYEVAAREFRELILKLFEQQGTRPTPKKTEDPEEPRD